MSLGIGIAGFGLAGKLLAPAIAARTDMRLVAIADPDPAVLASAGVSEALRVDDIRRLIALPDVDIVYIATPTQMHREHVLLAASAGKHIVVEKPIAATLEDALAMVGASEAAGVALIVGHSQSYGAPVVAMRALAESGELGRVRMIQNITYSDWIRRPRRPDELDAERGGGVTIRQGSHQFDIIRYIGGGLLTSVRARTFDLDPQRPAIGAHTAFVTFADGSVGTAIYNGYGNFDTSELTAGIGELGYPQIATSSAPADPDEAAAKRRRSVDLSKPAPYQPHFGFTLASYERGDVRQSPEGLWIYTAQGRRELALPVDPGPRDSLLQEVHDTIAEHRAPTHSGSWGVANLEVCLAAIVSAREDREITLMHQVPLHRG